jgi:uncharacterized membrane protein YcaP (DUF421 family)
MEEIRAALNWLLGISGGVQSLSLVQVAVRAVLIYFAGYIMLRLGEHRFLGKSTPFDIVLGFIFGTTLSRAINGTAPFFDTIAAGAVLLGLHWLFASLAFHSDRINTWLNDRAVPLIKDGAIQTANMRRKLIDPRLLEENVRIAGNLNDVADVEEAYFERNGSISIIPKAKPRDVRVLDFKVEDGVQTVRIELAAS